MIAIAILGLLLPGFLLARALRSPFPWAIAFPLSAVLLTQTVIVYTCLGIPLRFESVLAALVAISVVCCVFWLRRQSETIASPIIAPPGGVPKSFVVIVATIVPLVLLGLLVRSSLYPLSGFDTATRWDLLARLMFEHHGLSYYPPRTPADFAIYPSFADGMPPLVSTVYWWLYAAWGQPWAALTSVSVTLQAISCFALAFRAAQLAFGSAGGFAALAAASTTSLLLSGIAIGQETGFTALSYAGQFALALAAAKQPRAGTIVVAGMFAALGALARDYGPLLALAGFSALACQRNTRRYLPLFCLTAMLLGGLWYLRNWALTGNPFFPIEAWPGLPTNPVYAGNLAIIRGIFGLHNIPITFWIEIANSILIGAPLALLVGIPCLVISGRIGMALAIAMGLVVFLWLSSISYTSGGLGVSLRVLAPAWIALSIAAGALGPVLAIPVHSRGSRIRFGAAMGAVVLTGSYAALSAWSHPFPPTQVAQQIFSTRNDPFDSQENAVFMAKKLDASNLPPCGVLTDDCYFAVALRRWSRFQPFIIWNPEVAFAFDPLVEPAEVRRLLVKNNVRLIQIRDVQFRDSYLDRFFGQQRAHLVPVLQVQGAATLYLLPDEPPRAGGDQ